MNTLQPIRTACAVALAAAFIVPAAFAQKAPSPGKDAVVPLATPVAIEGGWVRASVPGQKATGAFMKLTAASATRLVAVSSPAAAVTEVHEMKMDGQVMRMRAITGLDLPAGQPVELRPGGYHVMLQDLKAPLKKDTVVPLTLTFRNNKGIETQVEVKLPVALGEPTAATQPAGAMKPMDGMRKQ